MVSLEEMISNENVNTSNHQRKHRNSSILNRFRLHSKPNLDSTAQKSPSIRKKNSKNESKLLFQIDNSKVLDEKKNLKTKSLSNLVTLMKIGTQQETVSDSYNLIDKQKQSDDLSMQPSQNENSTLEKLSDLSQESEHDGPTSNSSVLKKKRKSCNNTTHDVIKLPEKPLKKSETLNSSNNSIGSAQKKPKETISNQNCKNTRVHIINDKSRKEEEPDFFDSIQLETTDSSIVSDLDISSCHSPISPHLEIDFSSVQEHSPHTSHAFKHDNKSTNSLLDNDSFQNHFFDESEMSDPVSFEDEDTDEDEYDDDDMSDDSTVVNSVIPTYIRPPASATKEEQAQFYWNQCYGKNGPINTMESSLSQGLWSASRKVTVKSCMSAKKSSSYSNSLQSKSNQHLGNNTEHVNTPTLCERFNFDSTEINFKNSNPSCIESSVHNEIITPIVSTPLLNDSDTKIKKNVKFGLPSAAEFDLEQPVSQMTPLPSQVAKERFPIELNDQDSDNESEQMHKETARNAATLAMWDDDFDSYIDDEDDVEVNSWNDGVEEGLNPNKSSPFFFRKRKSKRNNRRSSTFFSKKGYSLINENSTHDQDDCGSIENNLNRNATDLSSFCTSSPRTSMSHKSRSKTNNDFENSIDKDTPNLDRSSLSSVLQTLHSSGGAEIGQESAMHDEEDDCNQELKPNLLDSILQTAECSCYNYQDLTCEGFNPSDTKVKTPTCLEGLATLMHQLMNTDYLLSHEHMSSIAQYKWSKNTINLDAKDFMHENNFFYNVAEKMDSIVLGEENVSHSGRVELSEVLNMILSILSQQCEYPPKSGSKHFSLNSCIAMMHQCLLKSELQTTYESIVEIGYYMWQKIEVEVISMALIWLKPLCQSNKEEEEKIEYLVREKMDMRAMNIMSRKRELLESKNIDEEELALKELEDEYEKELKNMAYLEEVQSFWMAKYESARYDTCRTKCFALQNILPFQVPSISDESIQVSIQHCNNPNWQTILTWKSTLDEARDDSKTTESNDSMRSLESVTNIMNKNPDFMRVTEKCDRNDENAINMFNEYATFLPEKSFVTSFYEVLLDTCQIEGFIIKRCRIDNESKVHLIADLFERLNLVGRDIIELEKYYTCTAEIPRKLQVIFLNVEISLGNSSIIYIKFTYDFTNMSCVLHFIPSEVFVDCSLGEPAVPPNILSRIAKESLATKPTSNAYILKRTCSKVIETLRYGIM
mmetsp:Transcript_10031/g.14187  ORF Transcript_10031/g.14187 Transcript_10031/m.14187 type:complete len:1214 (+) Transcript_10031:117-3758(+)